MIYCLKLPSGKLAEETAAVSDKTCWCYAFWVLCGDIPGFENRYWQKWGESRRAARRLGYRVVKCDVVERKVKYGVGRLRNEVTMLTKITIEFLATTGACPEGVQWFRDRPELHGASWQTICAALEKDGKDDWSEWVRTTVAICGTDEDRAVLRNDSSEGVREAVDIWGTAKDHAALRSDSSERVRAVVAREGTAKDRAALRNDPSEWVRAVVAREGTAKDRAALRNDPSEWVRELAARYGTAGE